MRKPLLLIAAGSASAAGASLALASLARRSPGALLIKWAFNRGNAAVSRKLRKHTVADVVVRSDLRYSTDDRHALLDLYLPAGAAGALPVVVWIHGGGWLAGSKTDAAAYFTVLAAAGHAVVSVDYTLTPGLKEPTPLHQIDAAVAHLVRHADALHIDPDRVVLAGDSAGAQLASQFAAAVTDPAYAATVHLVPALPPERLRAAILCCGVYDVRPLLSPDVPSWWVRWGIRTVLGAYAGTKDPAAAVWEQMSTIEAVTARFPPSLLIAGDADPLTPHQSRPMADRLQAAGVAVRTFFPDRPGERLGHEFQFDLDGAGGQEALRRTLAFLRETVGDQGGSATDRPADPDAGPPPS